MVMFDTRYDLRTGTDEEKNYVKKIKGELAEILEAPHVLSKLKGDDLKWCPASALVRQN
jgi:hypothetical protein